MINNSTIFVKNLIFRGRHGSTGRETLDYQRFRLNIEINLDVEKASHSDLLEDTYDYKNAIEIAREVIESENHVLIEKISSRIANKICSDPKINSTKIHIEKIDASRNGIPGISLCRKRFPQEDSNKLIDFDINFLINKITVDGGVSIPILPESYRRLLLEEALAYNYVKQPIEVGPAKVIEDLSSLQEFKPSSLFFRLKQDFQILMDRKLNMVSSYPFEEKLRFNEMSLQLYEKDSLGISPHLDFSRSINLICIFIITGTGKFGLCDDREKSNTKFLDATPGNVIIFRAPGFMHSDYRPFHFLSDITERRIAFGLRQNTKIK